MNFCLETTQYILLYPNDHWNLICIHFVMHPKLMCGLPSYHSLLSTIYKDSIARKKHLIFILSLIFVPLYSKDRYPSRVPLLKQMRLSNRVNLNKNCHSDLVLTVPCLVCLWLLVLLIFSIYRFLILINIDMSFSLSIHHQSVSSKLLSHCFLYLFLSFNRWLLFGLVLIFLFLLMHLYYFMLKGMDMCHVSLKIFFEALAR